MFAPYCCAADYVPPTQLTETDRLLLSAWGSVVQRSGQPSCALIHYLIISGDLEKLIWALDNLQLDFRFYNPIRSAIDGCQHKILEWLLRSFNKFDANVGYPLRAAILQGNIRALEVMMSHSGINPNAGNALYYAVKSVNATAVKILLSDPRTFVNKFVSGVGTTPLCAAVLVGDEQIVRILISDKRTDVNKGFSLTPLQIAVWKHHAAIVTMLLECPGLNPNKVFSGSEHPIFMAKASGQHDILFELCKDNRIQFPSAFIDDLEKENNVEVLQQLFHYHGVIIGEIWMKRYQYIVMVMLLQFVQCVGETVLLTALVKHSHAQILWIFLLLHAVISVSCSAIIYSFRIPSHFALARLLPFWPLWYFCYFIHLLRTSVETERRLARFRLFSCHQQKYATWMLPTLIFLVFLISVMYEDVRKQGLFCCLFYLANLLASLFHPAAKVSRHYPTLIEGSELLSIGN